MSDLQRVAEIKKNSETSIIFSLTEYREQSYVDIREHVTTDGYTGFTRKGIRFHADLLDEWIACLTRVRDALEGHSSAKTDTPEEETDSSKANG